MQIKEKIKKEIDYLDSNSLLNLYEYISILKNVNVTDSEIFENNITLKSVQEALSTSKKEWAKDLIEEREDRI